MQNSIKQNDGNLQTYPNSAIYELPGGGEEIYNFLDPFHRIWQCLPKCYYARFKHKLLENLVKAWETGVHAEMVPEIYPYKRIQLVLFVYHSFCQQYNSIQTDR